MPGTGLDPARASRLHDHLRRYVDRGELPGAVGLVMHHGELVHQDVVGWQNIEHGRPVQIGTIYPVASMSKPVTSVAALMLVERGVLRLNDPVAPWLPELAAPLVLPRPGAALCDAQPARTPITLKHLLTHQSGLVYPVDPLLLKMLPEDPRTPLEREVDLRGFWGRPRQSPDEFLRALAQLPLQFEPGTSFAYGYSTDVLGVLIARASGRPFSRFLADEVLGPLGMVDTGFWLEAERLPRLATVYLPDSAGALQPLDSLETPPWGHVAHAAHGEPPAFESGGAGLLSTACDMLRFQQMLLQGGRLGDVRLLARNTVRLLCTDHMTDAQRAQPIFGFPSIWGGMGFGLGVSVVDRPVRHHSMEPVGSFGWGGLYGGSGTAVPREGLAYVFLTALHQGDGHCRARSDWVTMLLAALDD